MRSACRLAVGMLLAALWPSTASAAAYDIPAKFDTATGLILIPVSVNGTSFWCNLDTGFSALFTLDKRLAGRAHLTPGPASATPDGRPAAPGDVEARATVDIGGVLLRDHVVTLRAYPPEAPDMQCTMGAAVLRDYIVEFDYTRPRVRLYKHDEFRARAAVELPLTVLRNTAFTTVAFELDDGSRHVVDLVVDTGASYFSVVLSPVAVEREQVASLTPVARWPSAGRLQPRAVRMRSVTLGPFTARGQVAALLDGPLPGIHDGLLGTGFWRQFTVAIDFNGAKLYLTPNAQYGKPQSFDSSGVAFRPVSDPAGFVAAVVVPDTPAARADIRPGDRLLKIDGTRADRVTGVALRDMLSQPGATVRLELTRGGEEISTTIRLEDRLK